MDFALSNKQYIKYESDYCMLVNVSSFEIFKIIVLSVSTKFSLLSNQQILISHEEVWQIWGEQKWCDMNKTLIWSICANIYGKLD